MSLQKKVLWVVDVHTQSRENSVLAHAAAAGATPSACARPRADCPMPSAEFHQHGMKVYAWRWPAVVPQPNSTTHYFAMDEAEFVATKLIPVGLDGYIADPESDAAGQKNDWNQTSLQSLAQQFCARITGSASAGFVFGLTSGCTYPKPNTGPTFPWAQFVAASKTCCHKATGAWRPEAARKASMEVPLRLRPTAASRPGHRSLPANRYFPWPVRSPS